MTTLPDYKGKTQFQVQRETLEFAAARWLPIETAPRDGTRILTFNVTPVYDEDERRTVMTEAISVAYWLFGAWMEYPASPRYVEGQNHTHWMPLPAAPTSAETTK